MQVLSKASINGLRALLYLAAQERREGYTGIREMAEELDISFHFLTKILQVLTQKGVLHSYRGPNGGVALARDPGTLYLEELVLMMEGEDFFDTCLLGLPGCGERKPCPVHAFWKETKAALQKEFRTTSLEELGHQIRVGKVRLAD